MAGELNIVVTLRVHAGKEAEAEQLLREMEAVTLANDEGCLRYEWYRAQAPQTYIMLERWTDEAAVQAHLKAPHLAEIFQKIGPLMPEPFTATPLTKL
jgi:quinol monooxygenase YgiN